MDKFMEKIKGTKILGIIGNLILAVAVFLPVLTVSVSLFGISQSQSISYIQGDGIFVLILAIVNLLIIFADKLSEKVAFMKKLSNQKFTLIPTAIVVILLIVLISGKSSAIGQLGSYASLANISYGIGFWLLWIGAVISAIYPLLYKGNETK